MTIVLYILLITASICSILSFIILLTLGKVVVNLNDKLADLVEVLYLLGQQSERKQQQQHQQMQQSGLVDIPDSIKSQTYDERFTKPELTQDKTRSIGPSGNPSDAGSWEDGLR
jgi:hypothetical protein